MRACRGFTIVEVLVALTVLAVGVLALVGSSAMTSRLVARGRTHTAAAQVAAARLERLRQAAASGAVPCTSPGWSAGSAVAGPHGRIREAWDVPAVGTVREVRVTVTYEVGRGTVTDTVRTAVPCL